MRNLTLVKTSLSPENANRIKGLGETMKRAGLNVSYLFTRPSSQISITTLDPILDSSLITKIRCPLVALDVAAAKLVQRRAAPDIETYYLSTERELNETTLREVLSPDELIEALNE